MPLRNRTLFVDYSCFFVTTTCYQWLKLFSSEKYFSLLYDSLRFVNKKYSASVVAYVFMPNHIHLILFFHEENHLSDYMRDFKKYTSTHVRKMIASDGNIEILEKLRYTDRKQIFKVWMDRFDDVVIRSRNVMLTKVNYIHCNPVKKGFTLYPEEYPHSSAGFYEKNRAAPIPILDFSGLI